MLALIIFDYGPVTAVSAPGIGPVYSARFCGVIHAGSQPSRPDAFLPASRVRANAGPGQFRLWPSDSSVGTRNRASVFGPILGRHSCRVSDKSATRLCLTRFFRRAELMPDLGQANLATWDTTLFRT
ncbi:hypothetical protein VZT92_001053 [Zoarces viviparus]|uniref:Uncharacterized protein n=1 Tax=Zoarces viviparus TaxID=48416 RepID=A0AAW1G7X5_ZOAVI